MCYRCAIAQAQKSLVEVKTRMEHGEFMRWLENEYRRSRTQANRYMQVARGKAELNYSRESNLSLTAALKMLAAPKEEKPPMEAEVAARPP